MRVKAVAVMLWVLVVARLCSVGVHAANNRGMIEIKMVQNGNPVSGGSITLYCVAEWDGNTYRQAEAFQKLETTELDWGQPETAKKLSEYAQKNNVEGLVANVSEQGRACFSNLAEGIYLVEQKSPSDGYLPFLPFVVSIPTRTDDGDLYEIIAQPKFTQTAQGQPPETGDSTPPLFLFTLSGSGSIWIIVRLWKDGIRKTHISE